MYDRQWARSIVENYQKLYTRVQQIDMCLQQLYTMRTGRSCLRNDIQGLLIDSLQGKGSPKLWNFYKRLVRKTPLDKDLLNKVAGMIIPKVDVEKLQRQFEWD